jgi:hypothetical protein
MEDNLEMLENQVKNDNNDGVGYFMEAIIPDFTVICYLNHGGFSCNFMIDFYLFWHILKYSEC